MRNLFQVPIGYADHTKFDDPNNGLISVSAGIMGFRIYILIILLSGSTKGIRLSMDCLKKPD